MNVNHSKKQSNNWKPKNFYADCEVTEPVEPSCTYPCTLVPGVPSSIAKMTTILPSQPAGTVEMVEGVKRKPDRSSAKKLAAGTAALEPYSSGICIPFCAKMSVLNGCSVSVNLVNFFGE